MRERLCAAALAVVAGCSMAPKYERPAAPVAAQFSPSASPTAGAEAADRGWRDIFADPRLQALIGLALANNRDLRIAALNVELTRAQYRIQRADHLPTVAASAGGEFTATEDGVGELYTVGIGASYEIDLFG